MTLLGHVSIVAFFSLSSEKLWLPDWHSKPSGNCYGRCVCVLMCVYMSMWVLMCVWVDVCGCWCVAVWVSGCMCLQNCASLRIIMRQKSVQLDLFCFHVYDSYLQRGAKTLKVGVGSAQTIHRSVQTIHRSAQTIHRSAQTIHRSVRTIHRSVQTIHRSAVFRLSTDLFCSDYPQICSDYPQICSNYPQICSNYPQICSSVLKQSTSSTACTFLHWLGLAKLLVTNEKRELEFEWKLGNHLLTSVLVI